MKNIKDFFCYILGIFEKPTVYITQTKFKLSIMFFLYSFLALSLGLIDSKYFTYILVSILGFYNTANVIQKNKNIIDIEKDKEIK